MFASISPLAAALSLRGSLVHPASWASYTAVPVAQGHLTGPDMHTTAPGDRSAPGAPPRTPA